MLGIAAPRDAELAQRTADADQLRTTLEDREATLTAERADYHSRTRDVELIGNIVAKSESGIQFTTGRIAYIAARSMLKTADRVKFSDANLAVEGIGMEFMVDTKQIKIMQQVAARYTPGAVKP